MQLYIYIMRPGYTTRVPSFTWLYPKSTSDIFDVLLFSIQNFLFFFIVFYLTYHVINFCTFLFYYFPSQMYLLCLISATQSIYSTAIFLLLNIHTFFFSVCSLNKCKLLKQTFNYFYYNNNLSDIALTSISYLWTDKLVLFDFGHKTCVSYQLIFIYINIITQWIWKNV